MILDNLTLGNTSMLAGTDQYNRDQVSVYIEHHVRKSLAPFGITLDKLLHILRVTRSVVSGSLVYRLLTHADFIPNDIDIYTPSSNIDYLLRLLQDECGYILDYSINLYLDNFAVAHVYWLRNARKSVINVMVTRGENALEAIFYFHSTGVMNSLSYTGIYCPWPRLTFDHRSLENTELYLRTVEGFDRGSRLTSSFQKYCGRGVDIQRDLHLWDEFDEHTCRISPCCPATLRSLHDAHGFFFRFRGAPTDDCRYDGNRNDIIWCLGGATCLQKGPYTRLLVHPFISGDVSNVSQLSVSFFSLLVQAETFNCVLSP